jgi:hypothetical protein
LRDFGADVAHEIGQVAIDHHAVVDWVRADAIGISDNQDAIGEGNAADRAKHQRPRTQGSDR